MRSLAVPQAHHLDPFEVLEDRSRRLANVVEAISKRSDVRRFRAKLVVLLLEVCCPAGVRPRRPWYVPGAVARLGAEGLRRAWRSYWSEEPPTRRTFDKHLGDLEAACVLVRAPGDWIPMMRDPEHPERRPRFPNTFHMLQTDEVARWWSTEGRRLLEAHPDARHNPDRWRMVFGKWREVAARPSDPRQLVLDFAAQVAVLGDDQGEREPVAVERGNAASSAVQVLAALVRRPPDTLEAMSALRDAGAHVAKGNSFKVAANRDRMIGAAAMLAIALSRGDRIRNRAGWLVRAWERATEREMAGAVSSIRQTTTAGDHCERDPTGSAGAPRAGDCRAP